LPATTSPSERGSRGTHCCDCRLEIELEYTRRELSRNIIDLREECRRRKRAEALGVEMQGRLGLLVNSNQHLEAKVRKYWEKLKSEKEKMYGLSDNQETGKGLIEEELTNNVDDTLALPEEPAVVNSKSTQKGREANPSLLMNEYQIDYKIHLQIMAREMEKNKKLANLSKLKACKRGKDEDSEQDWQRRVKRSTSNPLLYFNERRDEIMNVR
jgi:hypothetical protein